MTLLTDINTMPSEITLSDGVKTNQWSIVEITEDYKANMVFVALELGPFTEDENGILKPHRRRPVIVWTGDDYLQIKDTWDNALLIEKINDLLINPPAPPAPVVIPAPEIIVAPQLAPEPPAPQVPPSV